jgi:hypothetical protein
MPVGPLAHVIIHVTRRVLLRLYPTSLLVLSTFMQRILMGKLITSTLTFNLNMLEIWPKSSHSRGTWTLGTCQILSSFLNFSIVDGKTHCTLKSRHIIALSLKRLKERSYTRTTHSKTLKSSSPVCIQIGLNTLVELDYVGPKNCKS